MVSSEPTLDMDSTWDEVGLIVTLACPQQRSGLSPSPAQRYIWLPTLSPMPKIKKPTQDNMSAMTSDYIAAGMYRNRKVFTRVKPPRKSKSQKKQDSIHRFIEASQYAKAILKEPGMRDLYSRAIDKRRPSAHTAAVSDYLNAPVIHEIRTREYDGLIGDRLRIKATDDFQVTSVNVIIRNSKGQLVEKGAAVKYARKPSIWVYTATVANPQPVGSRIFVTAMDRPMNEAEMEVVVGGESVSQ